MNRVKCKVIPLIKSIHIQNSAIDNVPIYKDGKFLGIIFGDSLDWSTEVERRITKAEKALKQVRA